MIREQTSPVRTRQVFPVIIDSNPAVDQINEWLSRPFTLHLWFDNSLTRRLVAPRERMSWMRTSVEVRGLVASLNEGTIGDFLSEVALELGPDADLRKEESAVLVRAAMSRGDQSVCLIVPRRQFRYAAQAGDTMDKLANRFGIPATRLIAANPDAQPDDLTTDQQIVIPAQSSMLPAAIQPDSLKHIEVNLTTQQLLAYDGAKVDLTATISSGIPRWPTLKGVFQVEGKEAEVYNAQAQVSMPNMLTLYESSSPGGASNGFHALPLLHSGKRLWEKTLGKPASFGCIVMSMKDSEFLYRWAEIGTPVVIHGSTPPSAFRYNTLAEALKAND